MRYNPPHVQTAEEKKDHKERVDKIARKVAIVVAFISVFIWFIKIIFL
jgi:hypothetical protein